MTQFFDEEGNCIPVTAVNAGPCFVTQIKTREKDGYNAVQLGFKEIVDEKKIKKSQKNKPYKYLREFRITQEMIEKLNVGQKIEVSIFRDGDLVNVSGLSKGKGFQGVIKRWGFSGRGASHGVKHEERTLGSVGASTPARVLKGKKMPGRMGGERVTIKNLEVVKVIPEENLILIKGAIPGRKGTLVEIFTKQ